LVHASGESAPANWFRECSRHSLAARGTETVLEFSELTCLRVQTLGRPCFALKRRPISEAKTFCLIYSDPTGSAWCWSALWPRGVGTLWRMSRFPDLPPRWF